MRDILKQAVWILAMLLMIGPAMGQEADQQDEELPSLDELLGLEEESDEGAEAADEMEAPPSDDQAERDLDRELSAAEAAEQFGQAVQLMVDVAERLEGAADTGIETQRLQQDIIAKLDMLIRSQQQQQQQSSSSSSSQQQGQQQDQQQQQGQQSDPQAANQAGSAGGGADVPLQEGELAGQPASGAAWGRLPARIRDAVVQSQSESFSAMYRALTEAYYRRLAEQETEPR